MPMQRKSGHRGTPWGICDRCKFQFPLDKLRMQEGLLLDDKCYDTEEEILRLDTVADVLQSPTIEAENETGRIRSEPNYVRVRG